jgi:hypothetical protein
VRSGARGNQSRRRSFGLVRVILGTASGAQNLGMIGAFGVGGYVARAGLCRSSKRYPPELNSRAIDARIQHARSLRTHLGVGPEKTRSLLTRAFTARSR